jgi:hypothetical protein
LIEVKPIGGATRVSELSVAQFFVDVLAVSVTEIGDGGYLEVHSAVVDLGNFFIGESAGRYYVVHDMCVVDALIGSDLSVIEFDCGFYPG